MSDSVFKRHEIKFLLTAQQRAAVEKALAGHMKADEYGESTICSIYYDTPDSRLIRRSLEKPKYKEKLRVRSYGPSAPDKQVFIELKKKYDGIVYKRRISMQEHEASQYLAGGAGVPNDCQIAREIDYTMNYYGNLAPAMYLCYDRIAYFCPEDEDLRLTMDRNIRWRTSNLSLCTAPYGEQLLGRGESLMEIKVAQSIPMWLVKVLNDNNIRQTSFSKYGTAYKLTQLRKSQLNGGKNVA